MQGKGSAVYGKTEGSSSDFDIEYHAAGQIAAIRSPRDPYGMNWTQGKYLWGTVLGEYELDAEVSRRYLAGRSGEGDSLEETYVFRNRTDFDIFTAGTGLGICTPFPDYYTEAAVCMTNCCNTHIWCGGRSSYIMALRMGGEAPNLGLVLREGGLQGYSVERMEFTSGREEELSNHRGDFILHPESFHLGPGEAYVLTWELFWFRDKEDFLKRLLSTPDFVNVAADSYLVTGKEKLRFSVRICSDDREERPVIRRNGKELPCLWQDGSCSDDRAAGEKKRSCTWQNRSWTVQEEPEGTGEYQYEIIWKGRKSRAAFLVKSDPWELAGKRCRFIAGKQQFREAGSHLDGAYLIYDNETHRQYYGHRNDHNGGRERVGMGVLMAYYLQKHPDAELERSLENYLSYVLRELFDEETGEVFNDAPRCRDYIRLYNYPWMSRFFLELYELTGNGDFLERCYRCTEFFYRSGGGRFYAIGMPMYESVRVFREEGRTEQAEKLLAYYREHGDFILSCGKNYPAHEVDYEQSIVAPAAIYMSELYLLTGDERYAREAKAQLAVLDLFQGFQPDYHLNEAAVRHWDGYWFGKRRCLGDTFPHYWSALSGYAYAAAGMWMDPAVCQKKAENTLRAVLSLFGEDGTASCAMVYPMSVNGRKAAFYDPWANDQDWGLYYALKYMRF